jgi:hypothetical protein
LTAIPDPFLRDANSLAVSGAGPLRARLRIGELSTEAFLKSFGMLALGEAKDMEVGVVLAEGMCARTQRQVSAEEMDRDVVAPTCGSFAEGTADTIEGVRAEIG